MKRYILAAFMLLSCVYAQPQNQLASAFVQSIAGNNFKLLEPYLLTAATAKKLYAKELGRMTPAQQAAAIRKSRERLMDKWQKVVKQTRDANINFSKLKIKQVLTAPVEGNAAVTSLLVTYTYDGEEWDDLVFLLSNNGSQLYLLELPLNTAMFAMNGDRKGKNLADFQQRRDRNDPGMTQKLKEAALQLWKAARGDDTLHLYSLLVYRGEADAANRWNRPVDASRPEDVYSSIIMVKKLKSITQCDKINFGDVKTEKESEGLWYIIGANCNDQKYRLAFLKVNGQFLLGDMD